jgi:hypothetical protein
MADLAREIGHPLLNVECSAHSPQGIVVMGDRRTEDGHHIVAHVLVYAAAIAIDDAVNGLEIAVEDLAARPA